MTVYNAEEKTTILSVDEKFNRTYTNVYQVIATQDESPYDVGSAGNLPFYNTSYKWGTFTDFWAFSRKYTVGSPVSCKYRGIACFRYFVTVIFSTDFNSNQAQEDLDNPLDIPAKITGSFTSVSKNVSRDKDGRPLVNTAFSELPSQPVSDQYDTLSIEVNTATINLSYRARMRKKVNQFPMWGLAKRQLKLDTWRWQIGYAGDLEYVKNTLDFVISYEEHKPDVFNDGPVIGWYTTIPNKSLHELIPTDPEGDLPSGERNAVGVPSGATRVPIGSIGGIAEPEPVYLDKDGKVSKNPTHIRFALEEEANLRSIPGVPRNLSGPFTF